MKHEHIGSDFDKFLDEEGLRAEVQALAVKKPLAIKIAKLMRKEKLTKDTLAKRMKTSRAALDRLLDPSNPSVTLATLGKVAYALKCTLRVEFVEAHPAPGVIVRTGRGGDAERAIGAA